MFAALELGRVVPGLTGSKSYEKIMTRVSISVFYRDFAMLREVVF